MASKLTEVFDNVRSFFTGRVDDDKIKGGIGNDELDGGAGDDTLAGFMGHDHLDGGEGDDFLAGMRGKDYLDGGEGDDILSGGAGRDRLLGGEGDDVLLGGGGTDTLTGGAGSDTFVQDFSLSGRDDITDFNPAEDTIDIRGLQNISEISVTAENGGTLIDGGTGNTLFVANITPDQLSADNVTIDGNAITFGPGDTLESVLGDAAADQQGDDLNLRGFGGDQNFTGGAGNDTLGAADGNDTLAGGAGDDTLSGGTGEDNLDGGAGADTLDAGRGNDVLAGGAGNDILEGGAGDDALAGGEGRDTFTQDFSEEGADTISDFNPSQDTIDLKGFGGAQNASKITISEVEGGSTLIEAGSGTLLVEGVTPDQLGANNVTVEGQGLGVGSGEGDIESLLSDFASSSELAATDGADFLVGGRGDDVIDGGAGDDILDGGGGRSSDDVLDGGAGDDILTGRGGVDTLEGGTGDDILFGNRGNDALSGGAGDDILEGGRGSDTLEGGTGNDTFVQSFNSVAGQDEILDFNPAEDTIDLIDLQNVSEFSITAVDDGTLIDGGAGVTVLVKGVTPEQLSADNFTIGGNTINLGPGDTLESVVGDAVADLQTDGVNLAGSGGEQDFTGGDGADTLAGGRGADTLRGGAGDDTLEGQRGNDTLEGGAGDDTLSGGTGNDTLVGGAGDDTLGGGTGDDVLIGGAGSDTFIAELGKPGADTISDFNPSQDTIDLQGFGGIENISRLSVSEADGGTLLEIGTGGSLFIEGVTPDQLGAQNLLVKGEAIDVGSGGSDLLSILNQSTSDNETLEGGAVDDTLEVDASADVGASGEATATVGSEASAGAGVSIDGDAILAGGDGADTLGGGAGDDVLSTDNEQVVAEDLILGGGRGEDTLEGGAGDDRLRGRGGDDTLEGGAGDDILRGDKGDDTLDGGAGDDRLIGGTGEDTLEGGAGDDTLTGGKGDDTFIQDFGQPGEDTITDFNPNQDVIDFGGLNDFEDISISEVDGNTLISAGEGNTLTINNITPDQLSADNIKVDGNALSSDNFNLQSALGGGGSDVAGGELDALSGALGGGETSTSGADGDTSTDSALGNALDNNAQQGAAPAGGLADGAAGSDIVADEATEEAVDEEQVDEAV